MATQEPVRTRDYRIRGGIARDARRLVTQGAVRAQELPGGRGTPGWYGVPSRNLNVATAPPPAPRPTTVPPAARGVGGLLLLLAPGWLVCAMLLPALLHLLYRVCASTHPPRA